jgi:glucokinase
MSEVVAGFDIGGTKVALVAADVRGRFVHRCVEPTDTTATESIKYAADSYTYAGLSRQLVRMLRSAMETLHGTTLRAIGVVSAGPIRSGSLQSPPNIVPVALVGERRLPLRIPIVEPLTDTFRCPVDLLNDCNGAVLGEVFYGFGKETADKSSLHLAYATLSTGFGAGAWDGGHLILGKDGNAGEFGHIPARVDGLPCGCGNRGCVEAYASGSGIVTNARARLLALGDLERAGSPLTELLVEASGTAFPTQGESLVANLTASLVFEAAARGDALAEAVIADAVFAAGIAFSAIANAYDPASILVGGAVALAHPEILGRARAEMERHLNVAAPEVLLTPLGAEVTERGSVAVAMRLLGSGTF